LSFTSAPVAARSFVPKQAFVVSIARLPISIVPRSRQKKAVKQEMEARLVYELLGGKVMVLAGYKKVLHPG
jgi:hypothetical protein